MSYNNQFKSKLFTLSDKIDEAQDFLKNKLEKHGSNIIVELPLEKISSQSQVRKTFDTDNITQLATSIQKEGLLYPILVMNNPDKKGHYILLVGENRYRAVKQLKRKKINCRVIPYMENKADRHLIQLTENMQRKNLNAIETAESLMSIKKELNLTLEQLSKRVGRSVDSLKIYSRINNLSKEDKIKYKSKGVKELRLLLSTKKKKSVTVTLSKTPAQLNLFKETKTGLKLKPIHLNFKSESAESLTEKISQCDAFLKSAKRKLKKLS